MGSFNTTCAISHSPIRPNDKVRLLFIATDTHECVQTSLDSLRKDHLFCGSNMYASDEFRVLGGISLKCTYEDYNNYELIQNDFNSEYILNIIRKNYYFNPPVVETSEYGYTPDPGASVIPAEDLTFENIIDLANEGRLFFNESREFAKFPMVNIMAIHEAVYQSIIDRKVDCWWWEEDGVRQPHGLRGLEDYTRKALKDYVHVDPLTTETYKERLADCLATGMDEGKAHQIAFLMAEMKIQRGGDSDYQKWKFVFDTNNPILEMRDYNEKRSDEHKVQFPYNDEQMVIDVTESYYFDIMMNGSFYKYMPMGTSSQEYDLTESVNNLIGIAKAVQETNNRYDDEYLPCKTVVSNHLEIDIASIIGTIDDWYNPGEEDHNAWLELLEDFQTQFELTGTDRIIIPANIMASPDYEMLAEVMQSSGVDLHIVK